ncbi:hypothetical protein DSCA_08630 [Desulfosarcina alkanivorans]|uniref:Response regulatory domain-containing protein n=1 Tax=Desulfosarcina alkanivorans TaxID=571177 RepID=A0A5K7YE57_9BACT|nr:response regulator [Desulfosarcina alkanivorans]BBO66933.1 hypothetical protein DSCA_08630 [Desulfosarcina alkanivorans]
MPAAQSRSPLIPETVQTGPAGHPDIPMGWPAMNSVAHRILIVDDDPCILQVVEKMVQHLGCRTTAVATAKKALRVLSESFHDVVLTDYGMPWMDGCQLAARVKTAHPGIRVIIMTGHCEAEITDRLERPGLVDGLLLKPFNLDALRKKIETAITMESRSVKMGIRRRSLKNKPVGKATLAAS